MIDPLYRCDSAHQKERKRTRAQCPISWEPLSMAVLEEGRRNEAKGGLQVDVAWCMFDPCYSAFGLVARKISVEKHQRL
jgi:hypothetical protein